MFVSSVNLSRYNTLGIPALARWFVTIDSLPKLYDAIQFTLEAGLEGMALGEGSNIVFFQNYNGSIFHNKLKGKRLVEEDDETVVIEVSSGENWHELVEWTLNKKWYGLENLALIPGSVGAAPMQNIGAYGVELNDTFESLEAIEYSTAATKIMELEECKFGYRDSVFKNELLNKVFITKVNLKLSKSPRVCSDYPTLENYLQHHRMSRSPENIFKAICAIRRSKLPDPETTPNAGSFFRNPIVSKKRFQSLIKEIPELSSYSTEKKDKVKISAGYLVETTGWKGYRNNGIGIHHKQSLTLTNKGRRSGKEVLAFAEEIIDSVEKRFGITIEIEPQIYPQYQEN